MKKFTLLSILMLFATFAFAQKSVSFAPAKAFKMIENSQMLSKGVARSATHKAPRKGPELVQPDGKGETWYILDGNSNIQNEFDAIAEGLMTEVQVLIEKDDIYIQGLAYWFPDAWVKGTIDGKTVTIPTGQFLGEDEYGEEYFLGYDLEKGKIADVIFEYDSEEGLLTQDPNYYYIESSSATEVKWYTLFSDLVISKEPPLDPEVVEPPFGKEYEDWVVVGCPIVESEEEEGMYELDTENAEQFLASVTIKDNEFYIQGLSGYLPEAWLKGTIEGDKVTFASGQYFGPIEVEGNSYDLFFVNYNIDDQVVEDFVMTYDKEKEQLINETGYWMLTTVSKPKISNIVDLYFVYSITKYVEEDPDGITTVNNNKSNAVYYNLQGARMNKPTQKGIYIRNGKKMVVK